ncbi:MAG: 16S rRNA (cytosine(1402)-N(4))-methyltransferase RsmH [Thermodesulfobacteriota bacterium]
MRYHHMPVMTNEVITYLNLKPGRIIVDGTLGGGGHAGAILKKISPGGILIGIDLDQDSIEQFQSTYPQASHDIHLFHGNFRQLPDYLYRLGIPRVDGILVDLGISFHQIEYSGRGFSFSKDEPLDMRMDTAGKVKAEDLINGLDQKELTGIFKKFGEERFAEKIAARIVGERKKQRIQTSTELSRIVCATLKHAGAKPRKIHPATRVFMALRIAVNHELENLEIFMDQAPGFLESGGRLCILSFHSLEDRIVKNRMRELEHPCTCPSDFPRCVCGRTGVFKVLTRKPVCPSPEEIGINPMSRSAKLRAAERI